MTSRSHGDLMLAQDARSAFTMTRRLAIAALASAALGAFPAQSLAAVVWAVGDGADGSERARAVASRIAADRPDRFLYLGDVYEHGTAREFARNYRPIYGRLNRITRPTIGDHEWFNRYRGYYPYWRRALGRPIPPYYSFRLAGWQLLSLNSETSRGARSLQYRWLRRRLRPRGTCRLAYFHHPRFAAGSKPDDPNMDRIWRALTGRARVVLNGNEHNMQRLRPIGGITTFIVGSGGRSPNPIDEDDDEHHLLAFGNDGDDGALRLVLRRGAARWAFVRQDGTVLDSGRLRCRPLSRE
jgi:hypothetical protein